MGFHQKSLCYSKPHSHQEDPYRGSLQRMPESHNTVHTLGCNWDSDPFAHRPFPGSEALNGNKVAPGPVSWSLWPGVYRCGVNIVGRFAGQGRDGHVGRHYFSLLWSPLCLPPAVLGSGYLGSTTLGRRFAVQVWG